jgi:protein-tyrosine phosphatase
MSRTESVVFVCTGNINRSAAAEVLAQRCAAQMGLSCRFTSAATSPNNTGQLMSKRMRDAIAVPKESAPRSRPLTERIVSEADLILGVQQHHVRKIKSAFPGAAHKVRLLGEYGSVGEISDPHFNGTHAVAAAQIERATKALCDTLR